LFGFWKCAKTVCDSFIYCYQFTIYIQRQAYFICETKKLGHSLFASFWAEQGATHFWWAMLLHFSHFANIRAGNHAMESWVSSSFPSSRNMSQWVPFAGWIIDVWRLNAVKEEEYPSTKNGGNRTQKCKQLKKGVCSKHKRTRNWMGKTHLIYYM